MRASVVEINEDGMTDWRSMTGKEGYAWAIRRKQ